MYSYTYRIHLCLPYATGMEVTTVSHNPMVVVYTCFTVLMNSLMYRLIWAEVWVPLLLCVGKVPLYFKRLGYTPSEIYAMTYIPASMQLMYDDYTSRLLRSQNLSLTCAILKKK